MDGNLVKISTEKKYLDDLEHWNKNDPKTYKKVMSFQKMIELDPQIVFGRPERLSGNLKGKSSVIINDQDRLVYKVEKDQVILISCRGHYKNL